MKNIIQTLLFAVAVITVATGCKKNFSDLNQNSNKPTHVPPYLLVTGILNDMYDEPAGDYEKWCQYFLINYDYYGNNRYDFGSGSNYYTTLKNVVKMEDEARSTKMDAVNPYEAMAKFFKAYFFIKMSLQMGDIPMKEALKSIDNLTPVYDSQKEVFKQAFLWLDSANTDLGKLAAAGTSSLEGDIYLNGDLGKWQRVVNAFRLRLLIHLSKRTDDADLSVKSQFSTIITNPSKCPLMESAVNNLQYTYVYPSNPYPENPGGFGFNALRENCSATYVGLLTKLKDPRVYATTEPASAIVAGGKSPTDFASFVGADPGEDLGAMYLKANAGQYSLINRKRYYETYTGEPSVQIGYPEMCFNIAEAINRGWITAGPKGETAEDYYVAGIKASMTSYGIPETGTYTAYFLKSGSPGSSAVYSTYAVTIDFSTYYAQALVKYSGNNATGLTQILQQRYLALFRHSGLESYYTYRRTGVPTFTVGAGTGNSQRIAWRFQYPSTEKTANTANYTKALQSQYSGNDDINGVMWIVK
ncbi:MAG: SusD/RagB family nutrient-binding outer membrane lipoprotein [Chitinophagaceae bacterium]